MEFDAVVAGDNQALAYFMHYFAGLIDLVYQA
jgi:hypothetical protein